MKFTHVLQLLILVLFSTFAQAHSKSIEPQTVLKLIRDKHAPLILDVRSAAEFSQGHIPGAINISYRLLAKSQQLDMYKNDNIIIYCRSGRRAQIASLTLQKKGFTQLLDLNGHMTRWQKLNYPVAIF